MRWPVVLKPEPLESLSSWLGRHANYYKVSMETLFASGLNMNPTKNIVEIDFIKIPKLYSQIEKYTGINTSFLERMVLDSFSPTLFDFVGVHTKSDFDNYTNNFSPFYLYNYKLFPKKTRNSQRLNIIPWVSNTPWSRKSYFDRFCSECKKESNFYKPIIWHLCVVPTCQKHNCFLTETTDLLNKELKITETITEKPSKEIISLDKKTYEVLKNGQLHFYNGDIINGFIWFRFLRSLAKYVCPSNKLITPDKEMFEELWKNVPMKFETKIPFELLGQMERIDIMTIVSRLVSNWPKNFISKGHYNCYQNPDYRMRSYMPYVLSKYIDFPMEKNIYNLNNDFSKKCAWLRYEGLFDELRLLLKRDIRATDNIIPFLTEYGKMSREKAKMLINEFVKVKINRVGATAYDENENNFTLQTHSENFPPIEEQDLLDLPVYNELSY